MKLEFSQAHSYDLATLRTRAQARLEVYAARHPHLDLAAHFAWKTDRVVTGSYRGGDGTITLHDRRADVLLDLPFFARPFKDRITAFVQRELALVASPEVTLDQLKQ